jgi:hypothetical protein
LFASSSCLFGMWLYVVYVCACLIYLSVGCLVVNSKKSARVGLNKINIIRCTVRK